MATPDVPDGLFSWGETFRRAGKVVGASLPPVATLVGATAGFPIETTWLLQHWQAVACMGTALGAVLAVSGAKSWDLIRFRGKELAIDAAAATTFAGVATIAFLKVMEASMTGDYGMLWATEAVAGGVGAIAAYALFKRGEYRAEEKMVVLDAHWKDTLAKKKAKKSEQRQKKATWARAVEIWRVINRGIDFRKGAVSGSMEGEIAALAVNKAQGKITDDEFNERIVVLYGAAEERARQVKKILVDFESGVIDNKVGLELVRAGRKVGMKDLKRVLNVK